MNDIGTTRNGAVRRPNVLLVISHDTGRALSPFGWECVDTPAAERLAREGLVFERAFCTSPQCCPARGSLVTGRWPQRNGLLCLMGDSLHAKERTLGTYLQSAGYATWLLGLQHEAPEFSPYPDGNAAIAARLGFDHVDVDVDRWWPATADDLDGLLAGRDAAQPFFCQVGSFATHRPFNFHGICPDERQGVHLPGYCAHLGATGEQTRRDFAAFQGMVRHYDQGLGRILDVLDRRGCVEDTLVIVTTDHGEPFPRAKGTLYDPGIGVAMLMRWPGGGWSGGRRLDAMVSHLDILPTVLTTAGLQVPEDCDGTDLAPLIEGRVERLRDYSFAQKTVHDCYDPVRSVRSDRYKLIMNFERMSMQSVPGDCRGGMFREMRVHRGTVLGELYDLRDDPWETRNRFDDPDLTTIQAEHLAALSGWMHAVDDPLLGLPPMTPHHRAARALLPEPGPA
ncbi:MAG: sulfatase [Planctomycetota bacterium]